MPGKILWPGLFCPCSEEGAEEPAQPERRAGLVACHPNTWPAVWLELVLPSTFMGPWRWSDLAEGLVKRFGSQEHGG